MKKILIWILVCTAVLSAAIPVSAESGFIADTAGVLTSSQIRQLDETAAEIYDASGIGVFIVTVDYISGVSIESLAEGLYNNVSGEYPDSIFFIVALQNRDWTVQTFHGGHKKLSDTEIDRIMEDVLPRLSSGNYFAAFRDFLEQVEPECLEGTNWLVNLGIALLIGAVVALIVLLIMRHGMNTARAQSAATNYMDKSTYDLFRCQDFYLYSHTSRVRRSENSSSGSRSGGGSRGGRSGKF